MVKQVKVLYTFGQTICIMDTPVNGMARANHVKAFKILVHYPVFGPCYNEALPVLDSTREMFHCLPRLCSYWPLRVLEH